MREPFTAKVYHTGEVLPVTLLFHCEALLVKRDCWSYSPPLIQSRPIREKIWEALWKLEILISHLSPTGHRGTAWYCLLGCHPRGECQREVYESTLNRWPFMYVGGHLRWEDECKVYGYPCFFSSALGKHLFYQCTLYCGSFTRSHCFWHICIAFGVIISLLEPISEPGQYISDPVLSAIVG